MNKRNFLTTMPCLVAHFLASVAATAGFQFYGRSGDAIAIDFAALPGVEAGATFGGLNVNGFAGHTVLTSDTLAGQAFATAGKLWVFANPARDTPTLGDTNPAARGFQGTLSGSLLVDGISKTFNVKVQPGYTGSGPGVVGQSLERINRPANNPLFVAQQQQRLRYFGFVRQGGSPVPVTGLFDTATDQATRTFQAAFSSGVNATQANADGIIGPITAGWLNAANAPTWEQLVDPDPQTPGSFSVNSMIGNFDILPGRDPGTGLRTGLTPQFEQHATSWTIDLVERGAALAKATTGRTQLINALSAADGYGSSCCHSTHLVGTDIDLHVDSSTWNYGNGVIDAEEQLVIEHARSFIVSGADGRVSRIITSNQDILGGVNAFRPGTAVFDSSGVHLNHLHIDVGPPTRLAKSPNLSGDFNLDDVVDATDYVIWRDGLDAMYTLAHYNLWRTNFGATTAQGAAASGSLAVPEPAALWLVVSAAAIVSWLRFGRTRIEFHARREDLK